MMGATERDSVLLVRSQTFHRGAEIRVQVPAGCHVGP